MIISYDVLDEDGNVEKSVDTVVTSQLKAALKSQRVKLDKNQNFPVFYPETMIVVKGIK